MPSKAVWGGGDKGGIWMDCKWKSKEPYSTYDCTFYNDHNGSVTAVGDFALAEQTNDDFDLISGIGPFNPKLNFYNGDVVQLTSGKFLVPLGWIDYPFGDGHGKRTRYEYGREIETVSY